MHLLILIGAFRIYQSEFLKNRLFDSVQANGCLVIKFMQWYTSRSEASIFTDIIFENNKHHDLSHTVYTLNKRKISVELGDCIASGSIGQVYKGFYNGAEVAIKVRHPNIFEDMHVPETFAKYILHIFSIFSNGIRMSDYLDIEDFLTKFREQTDFRNEGRMMQYFHDSFRNEPFIIVPEVLYQSTDLLIMSYHDGVSLENLRTSTDKFNGVMVLTCFMKHSLCELGILHGDLHPGNYKFDNNKLVLYDFGITAKADPEILKPFLHFYHMGKYRDMFSFIAKGCLKNQEECNDDLVQKMIEDEELLTYFAGPPNMYVLLQQVVRFLKKYDKELQSNFISFVLAFAILETTFAQHGIFCENISGDLQHNIEWYRQGLVQQLSFMKQYDIFPELQDDTRKRLSKLKTNELFENKCARINSFSVNSFYNSLRS